MVLSCPRSRKCAARRVRRRAASISTADCAIISRINWKSPIGRPNALRSFTYFDAASRAARATPTAPAAMPLRPPFRVRIAWFQPSPFLPIRFSFGMRQTSNARSADGASLNLGSDDVTEYALDYGGADSRADRDDVSYCAL